MDPTVTFAPGHTNYLSDPPPSTSPHPRTPKFFSLYLGVQTVTRMVGLDAPHSYNRLVVAWCATGLSFNQSVQTHEDYALALHSLTCKQREHHRKSRWVAESAEMIFECPRNDVAVPGAYSLPSCLLLG